jgi:phenylacetate-CoA ligase
MSNMSIYQRLVRDVLYPLDRWRSGDAKELRYLTEFEHTQYLSFEQLRQLTFERVKHILTLAFEHCPFYQRQFKSAGVSPSDLRILEDLHAFPVLEKRQIQQFRDELIADNCSHDQLIANLTGGSTGTPLSFFVSRDRIHSRSAATWRHNRWAGLDIGDRAAAIWGAARDAPPATWKHRLRNLTIDRMIYLNTAQISEARLRSFDHALKRFRPKVIVAYARSIALFARYLRSHGMDAYQPYSIVTSAEVLEPTERSLIEDVFGCPIFNRYGCREVSVISSECREHNGMHTMAEGLHVEVMCGDRPARSGELGTVLITDLLNFGMPLIRYRIGDMAVPAEGPCPCGRVLPRLQRVEGRVTDFLVASDGTTLVSGAVLTVAVVARRPTLGQVQICQEAPGRVLFKIAPPDGRHASPADLQFLESETRHYLGTTTKVEFEFVEAIASEPSGKHIFCRSSAACDFVDLHGAN